MSTFHCTRCDGSGFLNLEQVDEDVLHQFAETGDHQLILDWIGANSSDVQVCDCYVGNGEEWYGVPGQHDWNNPNDPKECR